MNNLAIKWRYITWMRRWHYCKIRT